MSVLFRIYEQIILSSYTQSLFELKLRSCEMQKELDMKLAEKKKKKSIKKNKKNLSLINMNVIRLYSKQQQKTNSLTASLLQPVLHSTYIIIVRLFGNRTERWRSLQPWISLML